MSQLRAFSLPDDQGVVKPKHRAAAPESSLDTSNVEEMRGEKKELVIPPGKTMTQKQVIPKGDGQCAIVQNNTAAGPKLHLDTASVEEMSGKEEELVIPPRRKMTQTQIIPQGNGQNHTTDGPGMVPTPKEEAHCKTNLVLSIEEENSSHDLVPGSSNAEPTIQPSLSVLASEHETDLSNRGTPLREDLQPCDSTHERDGIDYICKNVCQLGNIATGLRIGSVPNLSGNSCMMILTCDHVKVQEALQQGKQPQAVFNRHSNEAKLIKVQIMNFLFFHNEDLDYGIFFLEHSAELEIFLKNQLELPISYPSTTKEPQLLLLLNYAGGRPLTMDPDVCVLDRQELLKQYQLFHDFCASGLLQNQRLIFYKCRSYAGSSGGLCINVKDQTLFAMHCGGVYPGRDQTKSSFEVGVPLKYVFEDCYMNTHSDERIPIAIRTEIKRLRDKTTSENKYNWSLNNEPRTEENMEID